MILSISKQSEAQVVTTTPHRLQNNSLIKFMGIKGILQSYQIGGRVYYKRKEVESAIVKLIK